MGGLLAFRSVFGQLKRRKERDGQGCNWSLLLTLEVNILNHMVGFLVILFRIRDVFKRYTSSKVHYFFDLKDFSILPEMLKPFFSSDDKYQ